MRVCGWFSCGFFPAVFLVIVSAVQSSMATEKLRVAYQWKFLDFAWPDQETRQLFPDYVRENNNPLGVLATGDRLFITIPRWKSGVAATLNYIYLNDTKESPLLNPYPSWEAHRHGDGKVPEVVSVFRIWADKCDRLWVLDMGYESYIRNKQLWAPPALLIYNLTTDQLLRKYVIPSDQYRTPSHFGNVVVEDASCDDAFAYLADLQGPGLIVYSWANNTSWLVKHHYFSPDPMAGSFNSSGLSYHWWDGIINLSLAPKEDGFSTLYFHPLCSNDEFFVDTEVLRVQERIPGKNNFYEFHALGSRGSNTQGAASYLDPKSEILFHALSIANNIACWKPGTKYSPENIGLIFPDNDTLIFPSDIKIDAQSNIWVMADLLPVFMYSQLDPNNYNFQVWTGSVQNAIAGTPCAQKT
ncbi:protein yellow-like [Neodiprion pinetum]|uniref:protein yellow-like n=1 Tax=Neodiprion pinetum TaxID=441929 RepID=UPI001EE03ED9|nr:protein yellow-like [Neodiprion pinetum]XP_046484187.1 protein yellow-like [Neodiprion pinetum]